MKLSSLKTAFIALGLVAGLLTFSSCNRGYGCPTDFSVDAIEVPACTEPAC
jgi:hypothetical protein